MLNPLAPKETVQWGRLVGEWECISKDLMQDGSWHTSKASWTFKYAVDGFAILDIWKEKAEDKTNNTIRLGRDFTGWNIRIYNPKTKKWECIWIDNRTNTISAKWEAYEKDGDLVMHDGSGTWQITFHDITEDSFKWKYEIKNNDSQSWKTTSVIKATKI